MLEKKNKKENTTKQTTTKIPCHLTVFYPAKLSFRKETEIKAFPERQKLKKIIANKTKRNPKEVQVRVKECQLFIWKYTKD